MTRTRTSLWLSVVLSIAGMLLIAPSSASALTKRFTIDVEDGPPLALTPAQEDCTWQGQPGVSTLRCTIDYKNREALSNTIDGSVTDTRTGARGTIKMSCDWEVEMMVISDSFPAQGSPPPLDFVALDGIADQDCSFVINMRDKKKSKLIGSLTGDTDIELVQPKNGNMEYSGTYRVTITDGTGAYENRVGTGTFVQSEEEKLPTTSSASFSRAASSAALLGSNSRMALKLKKGRPKVNVAVPINNEKIRKASKAKLRVTTGRGAKCTAHYRKRGTKRWRKWGTSKDGRGRYKDGMVKFGKRLSKLGKGTWYMRVTCTIPQNTGKAKVRKASRKFRRI